MPKGYSGVRKRLTLLVKGFLMHMFKDQPVKKPEEKSGKTDCPSCKGKGKIQRDDEESVCLNCKGSGKV